MSMQTLNNMRTGFKMPGGKYTNLLTYLREMVQKRTGKAVNLDPMEIDKRIRTYFEDIITDILKNPSAWEKNMKFDGVALYNYLIEPYVNEEEPAMPMESM